MLLFVNGNYRVLTPEDVEPIVDGVMHNVSVVLPVAIVIFGILLLIGLIPDIIRFFSREPRSIEIKVLEIVDKRRFELKMQIEALKRQLENAGTDVEKCWASNSIQCYENELYFLNGLRDQILNESKFSFSDWLKARIARLNKSNKQKKERSNK